MNELHKWLFLQHDDVITMNNYLYHSCVKGMKWGIRKDSKRTTGLRQQYRSEKDIRKKDLLKAKIKSVTNKKFSEREVGDIVNRANVLRSHDDDLNKSYNKIYDSLKKKGYSGFIDINDRKYSGYNSKRPTVIIDNKVLKQTGEKIISDSEKKSAYSGYINGAYKASAINFIKTASVLAIPYAAISGHKQNNDTVNLASEYFRKHKNSTIGLHEAAKNEEESRNKALREKYSSLY